MHYHTGGSWRSSGPAVFLGHFSGFHSLSGFMAFPFLAIVPGQDKHFHSAMYLMQRLRIPGSLPSLSLPLPSVEDCNRLFPFS